MVGMDIKHSHWEADLLCFRGKRNFTGFNSESEPNAAAQELDHTNFTASDSLNIVDQEDGLMDFDELSETLYSHNVTDYVLCDRKKNLQFRLWHSEKLCELMNKRKTEM